MSIAGVIILVELFCILQIIVMKKAKKKWLRLLPLAISGIGEIVGVVIYFISYILYLMNIGSKSVLSENQYFAIMVCVVFAPCLIGSLLGILYAKYAGKRRMLYFIPALIFIIAYIVMLVLGFGIVSVREVVWLLLFLISGFLLSGDKFWGSIFGMIPAVIFIFMSTEYTGQVINVERPLGIALIIYYLICSFVVYRGSKKIREEVGE
ncbi:MAG: hypothetical protein IKU39_08435 [Lachnospiraceae bacterium]|nr:hypothetical protein [Lachnospiraceae bacterium]